MSTEQYFLLTYLESNSEAEIRDEFDGQIAAFWQDRCGPDDWYTPVGVVTRPGRVVGLVPPDAQGELGGDGTHICAGIPTGQRWAWMLSRALQAVADDLELFRDLRDQDQATRQIRTLSFDDLLQAIHREVPARLAAAYRKMAGTSPSRRGHSRGAAAESRSFRISEGYRLLRQADIPPFTDGLTTPTEYRAFDLYGDRANAVAIVNIHTP